MGSWGAGGRPKHAIGPKSNEVPAFAPLLRELHGYHPLTGQVVTVAAAHAVKAHAELIVAELGAHSVFTVKNNTLALAVDCQQAADWTRVPVGHPAEGHAHGRFESRSIQYVAASDAIRARHPHVRGVARIRRRVTRTVTKRKGRRRVTKKTMTTITVFVIGTVRTT